MIRGLVHAPLAAYVSEAHGLDAVVHRHLSPAGITGLLDEGRSVMASAHYGIRHPELPAPGRGGHLVLLTSRTADGTGVHFHNRRGRRRPRVRPSCRCLCSNGSSRAVGCPCPASRARLGARPGLDARGHTSVPYRPAIACARTGNG